MTMILCDFDGSGLLSPERQAHKPKLKPVFSFVLMMSTYQCIKAGMKISQKLLGNDSETYTYLKSVNCLNLLV